MIQKLLELMGSMLDLYQVQEKYLLNKILELTKIPCNYNVLVWHLPFTCISEKMYSWIEISWGFFRMKTENLQCWSPYLIFLDQRLWTTWTMLKKTGAWNPTMRAAPCVQWGQGQWHTLPGDLDCHSKGMEMNSEDKQLSTVIR